MSSARGCFALSRSKCWKRSGVSSANEGIDSAILFHDLLVVRFDQHLQAEKHLDEICEVGRLPAGRNPRRHLLEEIVCGAELRLQLAVAREGQRLLHARQEKLAVGHDSFDAVELRQYDLRVFLVRHERGDVLTVRQILSEVGEDERHGMSDLTEAVRTGRLQERRGDAIEEMKIVDQKRGVANA